MAVKQAKSQSSSKLRSKRKPKKIKQPNSIRSDIWNLEMTEKQKDLARLTVKQYRNFLQPLVLIVYCNWDVLFDLSSQDRVNALEKMINKTKDNPNPKYFWYFEKAIKSHPS